MIVLAALSCMPTTALAQTPTQPAPAPAATQAAPKQPAPESAPPPTDEMRARAKQLFERGVEAYEGARYAEALASFQEAFRLRPHPLVRVNIANCYDKLGKPIEALFHFEQFLASDVPTPAQRQEVVAATERLRKQLGSLLLRVTPDGATVIVDAGEQRKTPILEPLQLPAGEHSLEVRLEGYQVVKRSFTLTGGATQELDVVLEPAASVAPVVAAPALPDGTVTEGEPLAVAPPPEPKPAPAPLAAAVSEPEGEAELPLHVWILGGVSVAMLAGATITGILALGAESDFERYQMLRRDAQAPLAQQAAFDDAIDAANRADTLSVVTDVLLVGAVASATAAIVFAVLDDGEGEPMQPSAALGPHQASLQLNGRF